MPSWTLPFAAALALLVAGPAARASDLALSRGQTVYVPVYSHITHGNLDSRGKPGELLLSSMLSIRNTDPEASITVRAVRYHGDGGKLLQLYLKEPRTLPPLAATDFFVEHKDATGGTGASFLVEWTADTAVNPPIIETVNAYFFGPHSLAFTSPGRPIRTGGK